MKQFKKAILLALAIMAFASNASAQCTGKTVYIQLPSDWPQNVIYVKSDNVVSIPITKIGSWFTFTFPNNMNFDNAGKMFNFTKENNDNGENRRITRVDYDVASIQNSFSCGASIFGTSNVVYIYPNPTNPSQTRYGTEPPDAYYFYFYPPNIKSYIEGIPYILSSSGTTMRMEMEPSDHCGWYKVVYFNEEPPSQILIGLGPNLREPVTSEPIDLKAKFDQLATNPMKREIYYVPENGANGWTGTDPGISDGSRCHYRLAANIYHTGCGANASFSAYDGLTGCSNDEGDGEGVCRGYVQPMLSSEGKMQWGSNAKSCASHARSWKSAADLNKAFDPLSTANVARCFDMPFQRTGGGLWEFDALYLCGDGTADMDGKGACIGRQGRLGGFYPPNLTSKTEFIGSKDYTAEYSACGATCGVIYQGDMGVVPSACVNMWCFDRGWYGGNCSGGINEGSSSAAIPANRRTDPSMTGNLAGLTTKAQIDAEMNRVCYRPIQEGDLANYEGTIPLEYNGKTGDVSGLMCFESHAKFKYDPAHEFFFRGDDDIWVFINNWLVVDLGGNHGPAPGYVKLDTITMPELLVEGQEYPISIFFCDRRAPGSNVRITTNIYFDQATEESGNAGLFLQTSGTGKEICLQEAISACAGMASGGIICGAELAPIISYELAVGTDRTPLNEDNTDCIWISETQGICYGGILLNNGVVSIDQLALQETLKTTGFNIHASVSGYGSINVTQTGSTPITAKTPQMLKFQEPLYYNLKGEPLGNKKPKKAGVYIVRQNGVNKLEVVR